MLQHCIKWNLDSFMNELTILVFLCPDGKQKWDANHPGIKVSHGIVSHFSFAFGKPLSQHSPCPNYIWFFLIRTLCVVILSCFSIYKFQIFVHCYQTSCFNLPEPAPVSLDSLFIFLYLGFLVPSSFSGVSSSHFSKMNLFYVSIPIILLLLMILFKVIV